MGAEMEDDAELQVTLSYCLHHTHVRKQRNGQGIDLLHGLSRAR